MPFSWEKQRTIFLIFFGYCLPHHPRSEFRVMKFSEHGIPFRVSDAESEEDKVEARSVLELLDADDAESVAELQWRISVPITLLVLTLIAVPLSRAPPRTGRYNNLAAGILIYVIYSNLLSASKIWVEQEVLPAWIGLWWVHALFAGAAMLAIGKLLLFPSG